MIGQHLAPVLALLVELLVLRLQLFNAAAQGVDGFMALVQCQLEAGVCLVSTSRRSLRFSVRNRSMACSSSLRGRGFQFMRSLG